MKRLDRSTLYKRFGWVLLSASLLSQLYGCADDEGQNQNPINFPLRVISMTPSNGEQFVDTLTQIELRMSAPLLTSTVNNKIKVTVADTGAVINGFATFSEGDTVLQFIPSGVTTQLPGNSQIKVELLAGIQSVTGQTMASPFASFFITGQGTGLGSHSNPGVAPTIVSITPGEGAYIPSGTYRGERVFTIRFSECVTAASLTNNMDVKYNPPFGSSIPLFPGDYIVYSTPDDRTLIVGVYGTFDASIPVIADSTLKLTVREGLADCNGDLLVASKSRKLIFFDWGF